MPIKQTLKYAAIATGRLLGIGALFMVATACCMLALYWLGELAPRWLRLLAFCSYIVVLVAVLVTLLVKAWLDVFKAVKRRYE